jgi:transcriptional regulator with PAS, ATPase and Fis domain
MDDEIIGADRGLASVMRQVRDAARTDVNILVRGETGSGKELIARAIHRRSARRTGPFVVANCAAVPSELMESEFFGHVRGAFTGAIADHAGFFEAAAGGTLVLDEIGDLHPGLQAKILRVVENQSFHRVGSPRTQRNRARLVAATNQPLEKLVAERRFRADLYYRLEVMTIDVPPLRQHLEDLPTLLGHFLTRAALRLSVQPPALAESTISRLLCHDWPGNVRELRNLAERLVVLDEPIVLPRHLDRLLPSASHHVERAVMTLEDAERVAIARALEYFGGNRTRAAQALGIGRRTLQTKIRRYHLEQIGRAAEG